MSNHLVIVESPAKAKTIKKYLGSDFEVLASYGHVRDLPPKQGAIKPETDFAKNDFIPSYQVVEKNSKHIDAIARAMKSADSLYLATDPDREGEAISWHVFQILQDKKLLKNKTVHRIVFHEITKTALKEAVASPRAIAMDLVNAQQARRALDYLVGFNLSPLLWKKVKRGLSAGRVQSPALRMIVEREEEIEKFIIQEYWTLSAALQHQKQAFSAKLISFNSEKLEQFSITTSDHAESVKQEVSKAAQGYLTVAKVEQKQRKRNPYAPFITSTLQQEAARKLGFTAQRTMRIAQQLYEGIDIGQGAVGLITYMRTDSVNLSLDAVNEIRALIIKLYGDKAIPEAPRVYKSKVKNAQEAHEAIRPTSAAVIPEQIKSHLTPEQYKLYDLIWKRTIACQMIHATINTVSVELLATEAHKFKATGSTIIDPGFLTVYQESLDDSPKKENEENMLLPSMKEGDKISLLDILTEQHFTEPPPRYSEASLIKALEEKGIGRPSTYASIISTLQTRNYVVLEQKRFLPTDVGRIVNKFLTQYFTTYVDYDFTAKLEDELDEISRGEKQWVPMLRDFWTPFKNQVNDIEQNVQRKDVTQELLEEKCPKCGEALSIRLGKVGRFIGCTAYPNCDYTRNLKEKTTGNQTAETIEGRECPKCQGALQIKFGRFGKFIGCSNYPKCKHIEPLEKPFDSGIVCPECFKGSLVKRKSRYGKYFFSCSCYPDCKYAIWNEPVKEICPQCKWPILTIKVTKRKGTEKVCPQKTCGFATQAEDLETK